MIFIANWKMYLPFDETISLATKNLDAFNKLAQLPNTTIIIAPTIPTTYTLTQIFKTTKIQWAAQDCSEHIIGAFTGQISAETIKTVGCSACIIGHHERRKYNGETNQTISRKLEALLEANLSPIICIGEETNPGTLGATLQVLEEQLTSLCSILKKYTLKYPELTHAIAYEPAWAIGSGNVPDNVYLENIFSWITTFLQKTCPATNVNLLYGGSISSKNILLFKNTKFLNGFLIGKASTDFQEFEKIVKNSILE